MMKIKIVLAFLLSSCAVNAQQTLSIEQAAQFTDNENDLPEDTTQVHDLNNILDPFVGTWNGSYNGNSIKLKVFKYRSQGKYSRIEEDALNIKYYIFNPNGNLIVGSSQVGISEIFGITYSLDGSYQLRLQDACYNARAIYIRPYVDMSVSGNHRYSEKRNLEFVIMPDTLTGISSTDDTNPNCVSTTNYLPITEMLVFDKE